MNTLLIVVAGIGYGMSLLLFFIMNALYSMYWRLQVTQEKMAAHDPEKARIIGIMREVVILSHIPFGWASLVLAIGTTVLLVILILVSLFQDFG